MRLTVESYYFDDKLTTFQVDTADKLILSRDIHRQHEVVDQIDSFQALSEFLASRQVDFGRVSRPKMLGYERTNVAPDVWHEIGLTFGFDADDYFWFRIPELTPKNRQDWTWRDFNYRVNPEARSVYYG